MTGSNCPGAIASEVRTFALFFFFFFFQKSAVNFISKSAHPQKVILAGKCTCFARDVIISMATGEMERSDWLRAQIVVTCRCILHDILLVCVGRAKSSTRHSVIRASFELGRVKSRSGLVRALAV